jgi:hypothetical protein
VVTKIARPPDFFRLSVFYQEYATPLLRHAGCVSGIGQASLFDAATVPNPLLSAYLQELNPNAQIFPLCIDTAAYNSVLVPLRIP